MGNKPHEEVRPISSWDNRDYLDDREKINTLKSSTSLEDRITGILIDDEEGCFGFWEIYARSKAVAIVKMMEETNETEKPNS